MFNYNPNIQIFWAAMQFTAMISSLFGQRYQAKVQFTNYFNLDNFFTSFQSHNTKYLPKPLLIDLCAHGVTPHCPVNIIPSKAGAMKRGQGTCSTFQSFPAISANVPYTYYVHRDIYG